MADTCVLLCLWVLLLYLTPGLWDCESGLLPPLCPALSSSCKVSRPPQRPQFLLVKTSEWPAITYVIGSITATWSPTPPSSSPAWLFVIRPDDGLAVWRRACVRAGAGLLTHLPGPGSERGLGRRLRLFVPLTHSPLCLTAVFALLSSLPPPLPPSAVPRFRFPAAVWPVCAASSQ